MRQGMNGLQRPGDPLDGLTHRWVIGTSTLQRSESSPYRVQCVRRYVGHVGRVLFQVVHHAHRLSYWLRHARQSVRNTRGLQSAERPRQVFAGSTRECDNVAHRFSCAAKPSTVWLLSDITVAARNDPRHSPNNRGADRKVARIELALLATDAHGSRLQNLRVSAILASG